MVLIFIFLVQIVFLIVPVLSQNRNSPCLTPNRENGRCIPVRSCSVITDALASGSNEAIKFAQKSQCGYDSVPLVCCGSKGVPESPNLQNVEIFSHRLLPSTDACGIESTSDKIVGGLNADLEEFPWLALLRYTDDFGDDAGYRCGGSLINQRYILTAAHCVVVNRNQGLALSNVRLGEWKLSTSRDCIGKAVQKCAGPVVDLGIERTVPHPRYNTRSKDNDIALIRMQRNVQFTDYIKPICLPSPNENPPSPGDSMMVAGWGSTETASNSDIKQKVSVPIVSSTECSRKIGRRGFISDNQVCAGGVQGKDSCQGDSGGPLMKLLERSPNVQWIQEGVISWGIGCGLSGYPGIYTRVSRYSTWVGDNMSSF